MEATVEHDITVEEVTLPTAQMAARLTRLTTHPAQRTVSLRWIQDQCSFGRRMFIARKSDTAAIVGMICLDPVDANWEATNLVVLPGPSAHALAELLINCVTSLAYKDGAQSVTIYFSR